MDDDIVSIDELLEGINKKLSSLQVDIAFIKDKVDHLGKKVYWIDNKCDQLLKK